MLSAMSEGRSVYAALKKRNGLRSLLSLAGGRLPAEQAVSKPDAKAAREQHVCKQNAYICQDSEPETSQNGGSDIGQLLCRDGAGNELTLAARTRATVLETIKPRSRNRHSHVTFGPHLPRRKWAWQRLQKRNLNMVRHLWVGRCRAQRNNRDKITASRQSWNNDHNRAAFDHFRNNETAKVTQQYFTQLRIIHQRHISTRNSSLKNLEGRN
jgi:hypothetical protein